LWRKQAVIAQIGNAMTETTLETLRLVLAERYDELRHRLTRRLGSDDRAREILHETWLHLHGKGDPGRVGSPVGYLLRSALNLATDRERSEGRRTKGLEVGAMLDMVDDAPGPDREVEARRQVALLEQVLEELSPRRRAILLASRLEGIPLNQIAAHLGISQRYAEVELKAALAHCAKRFGRPATRRFGPGAGKTSL
jgi:RNA polymerase sigma factor (sigma-70 family)